MRASPVAIRQPAMARRIRQPQHPFAIRQRPWAITPFFIAPVLPGETMKNLLLSSRCVTDPIVNPIQGWWLEYYFFYVKHRDLADRAEFEQMMLDPSWSDDNVDSDAANIWHYFHGDGINWLDHITRRILAGDDKVTYFRNTGEPWNSGGLEAKSSLPKAAVVGDNWTDSLLADEHIQDMDVDVDLNADDTITASEIDQAMRTWEMLHEQGLTDMTYEDYLATFGTRVKKEELHVPELVRFVRRWSYPSNTIDPATGQPSSAVSWSIQERADKDRFFKEPGFLVGYSVCRPKVFLSRQKGTVSSQLNSLTRWLPAVLSDDPSASMVHQPDVTGLLGDVTDAGGYWFDMKDLLIYGEQFVNQAFDTSDVNHVTLPAADLTRRYPTDADIARLFVDQDDVGEDYTATRIWIRQDGLVSLNIAGRQVDTSITRVPVNHA